MIIRFLRFLQAYLDRFTQPAQDELVSHLVVHVASIGLARHEYVELAPIKGCCGAIKMLGNSLPVFEYVVFDKAIMEFIKVRIEVSKPDRIQYRAFIESKNTEDKIRHGEEIEVKPKYKEPFEKLVYFLFRYFPVAPKEMFLPYQSNQRRKLDEPVAESQKAL